MPLAVASTLRRPSEGENLRSSSMTPLCPLKAALNKAVDPSCEDDKVSVQIHCKWSCQLLWHKNSLYVYF